METLSVLSTRICTEKKSESRIYPQYEPRSSKIYQTSVRTIRMKNEIALGEYVDV